MNTKLFQQNLIASKKLVAAIQAHPGWSLVTTVDEGVIIAEEVWKTLSDPLSYTAKRTLRSLVRQTLYAEALACKLKTEPNSIVKLYRTRLQYLSLASESLSYCYAENLLTPEAEPIALAALGMLEAHETAVVEEAMDLRLELKQSSIKRVNK